MNQEVKMKPSYLKIAFLDRDGTIIKDYPDEKWREIKEPEFLKGSIEGLKRLKEMGYDFIIITNQYLINDGIISLNDYQQFTGKFLKKLKEENIDILKIFFSLFYHPWFWLFTVTMIFFIMWTKVDF